MTASLKYLSAAVLAMAVAAAILLFTPLGERPLRALFPLGDAVAIEFATLSPGDKPNRYLLCPPGHCAAPAHGESPVFDISVETLRERWREVVARQPKVELLRHGGDRLRLDYVQRTARFRFPDLVTVRLIALSPTRSTLAVYSRSIYGRGDFGANRVRVETWIAELQRAN